MKNPVVTYAEYLAREATSEMKHETEPRIEVFRRREKTWVLTIYEVGEVVHLESFGIEFHLDTIYADPRSPA